MLPLILDVKFFFFLKATTLWLCKCATANVNNNVKGRKDRNKKEKNRTRGDHASTWLQSGAWAKLAG